MKILAIIYNFNFILKWNIDTEKCIFHTQTAQWIFTNKIDLDQGTEHYHIWKATIFPLVTTCNRIN